MSSAALFRFDFARGYSGDHVADYCEASSPEFAVAEFWDSLAYRRGVPLRNQARLDREQTLRPICSEFKRALVRDAQTAHMQHRACRRWPLSLVVACPLSFLAIGVLPTASAVQSSGSVVRAP